MDYEESYHKTIELLEKRILSCEDIDDKLTWIETYKQVAKPEDIKEEVMDLEEDFLKVRKQKGKNLYSYDLPESFMEKFHDILNWKFISMKQDLDRDFIMRNKDLISFEDLNLKNYMKLEDKDIKHLSNKINWNYISMRDDLSVMFVREHKDKLNWSYVSINISFTEEEMEEFSEYIDWKMATICQVYSDDFSEKHELNQYVDEMKSNSMELVEEFNERTKEFDGTEEEKAERYEYLKELILSVDGSDKK